MSRARRLSLLKLIPLLDLIGGGATYDEFHPFLRRAHAEEISATAEDYKLSEDGVLNALTPRTTLAREHTGRAERAQLELWEEADDATVVVGSWIDTQGVGNPIPNRCSEMDLSLFDMGKICGSPLSSPCFDHRRCEAALEGNGPSIYVYDYDCTLTDSYSLPMATEVENGRMLSPVFRNAAHNAGVLAKTYASACVFIHVNNRVDQEPCATTSPLWNNGANHLMIDLTDSTRDKRPGVANSLAMEGASNIRTCYYRSGYDMSVPLSPERLFLDLADIPATERRFFLTVKGSVYLGGHGSEERMALVPLQDEANGVIASMHCFEYHQEHLLPENVKYCETLKEHYDDYDYKDLMNTTFGIVPAGRSPGTYRLAEVMSAGAIPVIVARDIVRPFREQFDWPSFSFVFAPDQVGSAMVKTLRAVPPETLLDMQRKSLEAFNDIFGESHGYADISKRIIHELGQRIAYQ